MPTAVTWFGGPVQVMMPEGAVGSRGAQKSALAGVLYDKKTEKELGQLLEQLKGATGLDPVQAAVVREAQRWVLVARMQGRG